jgi:hypothetical protein
MDLAEEILNKWLGERPQSFTCSITERKLVPEWLDMRGLLIQGVFDNWKYLKVCANADCAAPYFIAKRKDQTVGDAEACKSERQREHARKWWKENRARTQGPMETRTKKGTVGNGTRKAR